MSYITQDFCMPGYLVLIFLILLLVVFFLAKNRTKRIQFLEKVQLQTIYDNIAFANELLELGLSDEQIQELRDKFTPENDSEDNKRVWLTTKMGGIDLDEPHLEEGVMFKITSPKEVGNQFSEEEKRDLRKRTLEKIQKEKQK